MNRQCEATVFYSYWNLEFFKLEMFRICGAVGIFVAALSWLYFLASNAPSLPENESLQFPSSLEELKKTSAILTRLFDHVCSLQTQI
jgi:hypothetical protein